MKKFLKIPRSVYEFYERNLAFLLLLFFFDATVIGIAASVPYLNWFLDILPLILIAFDWVIVVLRFRPNNRIIFMIFLGTLIMMFLMELISYQRFERLFGIVVFGLVLTMTTKSLLSLKNEEE